MIERDEIDILAGEYVLGTLDAAERVAAGVRRRLDPVLAAAIETWEQRLAALAETVPPLPPPAQLRASIEARITARESSEQVVAWRRRAQRWRRIAVAASALAAVLLMVIGLGEFTHPQAAKTYVAVFQKDDASPAFLLTVDLDRRLLSVRPVAAVPPAGKSYQLWIASERFGGVPQSLGLIEAKDATTEHGLAQYDPASVERATFGISLEPVGGSPTGRPTGPAFHAKLIKATR